MAIKLTWLQKHNRRLGQRWGQIGIIVINGVGECMEYHGDGMCLEFRDRDIPLEKSVLGGVP